MPSDSVPQPQAIQAGWRERLSLLRVSDFRKIWLAGGLYGTVRWLDMLAVGVFTYEVTNSPLAVAFMVFLRLLPLILMGTVIGALAERFYRRRMLLGGLIFEAVFAMMCLAYHNSLTDVEVAFIGPFPAGVSWLLFGMWIFPVFFILLYVVFFERWILPLRSVNRFAELTAPSSLQVTERDG